MATTQLKLTEIIKIHKEAKITHFSTKSDAYHAIVELKDFMKKRDEITKTDIEKWVEELSNNLFVAPLKKELKTVLSEIDNHTTHWQLKLFRIIITRLPHRHMRIFRKLINMTQH